MSATTTRAPSAATPRLYARPIPLAPPVTITTLSSSLMAPPCPPQSVAVGSPGSRAAAYVPDETVGGGRVAQSLHRDVGQGQGLQRDEDEARREPLDEARPGQCLEVHGRRDLGHEPERHGLQQTAPHQHEPLVHP